MCHSSNAGTYPLIRECLHQSCILCPLRWKEWLIAWPSDQETQSSPCGSKNILLKIGWFKQEIFIDWWFNYGKTTFTRPESKDYASDLWLGPTNSKTSPGFRELSKVAGSRMRLLTQPPKSATMQQSDSRLIVKPFLLCGPHLQLKIWKDKLSSPAPMWDQLWNGRRETKLMQEQQLLAIYRLTIYWLFPSCNGSSRTHWGASRVLLAAVLWLGEARNWSWNLSNLKRLCYPQILTPPY